MTLRERIDRYVVVHPKDDIVVQGTVRDPKKLLGPRLLRVLFSKLDRIPARARTVPGRRPAGPAAWIGNHLKAGEVGEPLWLPLPALGNVLGTGWTGSGKTVAFRTLEESALLAGLRVVILDPTAQGLGLLVPQEAPEILGRYARFGLERSDARGFAVACYAPGLGRPLPRDITKAVRESCVVSFKGMDGAELLQTAGSVLDAVLREHGQREARLHTVVVAHEAHRLTRKGHPEALRDAADRVELAIDLGIRELRKFGVAFCLETQSSRSFNPVTAIRSNCATRLLMANSGREIVHAAECLSDGTAVTRLGPAQAWVWNASLPEPVLIAVRPPLSTVAEVPGQDIADAADEPVRTTLSAAERAILDAARDIAGRGRPGNIGEVMGRAGVTSKRRLLAVLARLESLGLVTVRTVAARGAPRLVVPSESTRTESDGTRTKRPPGRSAVPQVVKPCGDPSPDFVRDPRPSIPNRAADGTPTRPAPGRRGARRMDPEEE